MAAGTLFRGGYLVFSDDNKNTSTYSVLFVHLAAEFFQLKLAEYNYFPLKDILIGNTIFLYIAEFAEKPIVCENQPVPSSSK